ncbi:MAG TPA: hypothetical protein VJ204_11180 [Solirubrobacterales bacterium]|nr:hypothetical protein [Solirubrobacterales bacterium]
MTNQTIYSGRLGRASLILAAMALLTMVAVATAGAKAPVRHPRSVLKCREGSESFSKIVRSGGKAKVVRGCRRKATKPKSASVPPAPSATASAAPVAEPTPSPTTTPAPTVPTTAPPATVTAPETTTPPETVTPPTETEPVGPTGATEVHAAIGTGFDQNPLVPDEVTWSFSASATRTATVEGVPRTETAPLPSGELAFFVDGKLECEIHAIGAIDGSACTSVVKQLGAHEVTAIFTDGELSSTVTRIDYLDKYPTQTNLQVSIEPTAPEYLAVGEAPDNIQPEYGFEVGRVRITGSVDPGGVPTFSCEGEPVGCLIPEVSLNRNTGSASVPLYAQYRLNSVTGREEWHVAFDAYQPSLRKEGRFWQFPAESVGDYFFHAVAEPSPSLYEPSSITVPLNLQGGHYPFYHWYHNGESVGGPVAAVEGSLTPVITFGTYEKLTGLEGSMPLRGEFYGPTAELEGCEYYVTIDGKTDNEARTASNGRVEIYGGFTGNTSVAVPAGVHTLGLAVERTKGAGPGKCTLTDGYFETYEKLL